LQFFIELVLESGKSAIDLALYILLPIMVVMMALMKWLEARGVLAFCARLLSPILRPFGLPGIGVFAMLQLLLVSFAAPLASLSVMENDGIDRRRFAATLAMILTMSQANAVFPLVAVGLDLPMVLLTSMTGGLIAAALTYYGWARDADDDNEPSPQLTPQQPDRSESSLNALIKGGQEGVQIVLGSIPILILAVLLVGCLDAAGAISLVESTLSPLLSRVGLPAIAILPLATKYLAGGTAMIGVTLDLLKEGAMTVTELNRIAGFLINPCDPVGVAVLISAGRTAAAIVKPAILGAAAGILIRGILHLLIF
jgi:spore maturation protein SpmB